LLSCRKQKTTQDSASIARPPAAEVALPPRPLGARWVANAIIRSSPLLLHFLRAGAAAAQALPLLQMGRSAWTPPPPLSVRPELLTSPAGPQDNILTHLGTDC
jgi:hypothetical protein